MIGLCIKGPVCSTRRSHKNGPKSNRQFLSYLARTGPSVALKRKRKRAIIQPLCRKRIHEPIDETLNREPQNRNSINLWRSSVKSRLLGNQTQQKIRMRPGALPQSLMASKRSNNVRHEDCLPGRNCLQNGIHYPNAAAGPGGFADEEWMVSISPVWSTTSDCQRI